MQILHTFLVSLLLTTSFLVFTSSNPVHSVLFLILTFCEASSILFLFNVDFLGLLFIIIYVGAIAVLFLFVVMMLNVKVYQMKTFSSLPLLILGAFIFFLQLSLSLNNTFSNLNNPFIPDNFIFFKSFDNLNNLDVFGQVLYNYFIPCFLLAGLVLLVAMIGAIVLTLTFTSKKKNELVFKQLSRSDNILSYFK